MLMARTPGRLNGSGSPLALDLPPAADLGTGTLLLATIRDASRQQPFGVWEFRLPPSWGQRGAGGRLLVTPAYLDQAFFILDHPQAPPLGSVRHIEPPTAGLQAIDVDLYRSGPRGDTVAQYRLNWASEAERAAALTTWTQQAVPPVEWFYVELTSHCNLSCPFCPSKTLKRPRAWMSEENAARIFSAIGAYMARRDQTWGYTEISRMVFLHVMGEPLLHPHFVACVDEARKAGLTPALFTNATLLSGKAMEKIFDAGIKHITVSLNVTNEDGYATLGARDSFAAQEDRAAALLAERARRDRHDLHVDIQYMVSEGRTVAGTGLIGSREAAWETYRRWLLRLRAAGTQASRSTATRPIADTASLANPLASENGDVSLRLPLDDGVDLVMKAGCSFGNAVIPAGMRLIPTRTGRCPFENPWRQMAVYVDGSVSFCNLDHENETNLGNLLDQSVEDIWGSPRMTRIRREMATQRVSEPVCQRCLGTLTKADRPSLAQPFPPTQMAGRSLWQTSSS